MIRLAVVSEGLTEKEFVGRILAVHLKERNIQTTPIALGRGSGLGGGNVTIERIAMDMARRYWSFDFVASLVDFYGFRDKGSMTVEYLEMELSKRIGSKIRRKWD